LMYGTPHATFIIKGAVENIENDQPIEGIQVKIIGTFIDADDNERIIFKTKGVTDEDGHFKLRKSSGNGLPIFVSDRVSGSAHFSDIENEQFEDKTLKLDFEDFEQTRPAGSWFRGEFTKTLPTVQLTPRTDEDYEEENEAID